MSPSRRRVLRPIPAALSAAALAALVMASISPLVPHAAALDPTPDPSASATADPTPDPGPTPTADPAPTATPDAGPTATPDPGPAATPDPTPDVPPTLAPGTSPQVTPDPSPTPDPMEDFPLYPLVDPLPPVIVPMSLLDPSLPSPHTMDSLVSDGCGSCHRSHAASDEILLVAAYRTDLKPANEAYARPEFALCYTCHDPAPFEAAGTGGTNFDLHAEHLGGLADGDTANAECAECHYRLHGISSEAGSKLVNFAPNVTPNGVLEWTGTGGRSCTLTCHGFAHDDEGY